MSNIASFARIGGQVRFSRPPESLTGQQMRAIWAADYAKQLEAIRAFGLPADLPQSTHGKTTLTNPVVLPADITETLRRVREMRGGK